MVGGDVDGGVARCDRTLGRDAVDRLDLEAVVRVGLQVPDGGGPDGEAQTPRRHVHVLIAAATRTRVALLTHHVVHQVGPAPRVTGLRPLQRHRGLVHAGDDTQRG